MIVLSYLKYESKVPLSVIIFRGNSEWYIFAKGHLRIYQLKDFAKLIFLNELFHIVIFMVE